jgi:hypothetical protein
MTIRHIATHTDAYGDRIQIKASQGELGGQHYLTVEAERGNVFVFTPESARRVAADLVAAAEDTDAAVKETAREDPSHAASDMAADDPWATAPNGVQDRVCGWRLEAVRSLASCALGYVQAEQSDRALYDMLSALERALERALDGDDADALAHLKVWGVGDEARGRLSGRQREAWGVQLGTE